jgi:hypothetical protein
VRAEALLLPVVARVRSESMVEWPRKGHTAEYRRSKETCMGGQARARGRKIEEGRWENGLGLCVEGWMQ